MRVDDDSAIRLHNLTVEVAGNRLLEDVRTTIPAGKITLVVGGSGAGKSVLLRILAGLLPPEGDPIRWTGEIARRDGRPLSRPGIVFQQFALFDELSPTANVAFATDHRRRPKTPPEQSPGAWLEELRVPADTPVAALSGGQKQRLAIARTLAADPEVLLYDEPTSGLDAASGRQVAELIRRTQQTHGRTSIVVTHDYATLLRIADHVLVLDPERRQLVEVPPDAWDTVAQRMRPVATPVPRDSAKAPSSPVRRAVGQLASALAATGDAATAAVRLPWDALPRWPRPRWALRFLGHYLWLVTGPSAIVYLLCAGIIVGFVTTYFTFRYLPYALYTKPLLLEDLLSAIGFALYRVLTPVLATVLVAARCGAAVAADTGVKRYGGQTEALQTLGVRPAAYLLSPILISFAIGTPLLEWVAFQAAQAVSLMAFTATHADVGPAFWDLHFHHNLRTGRSWFYLGSGWLVLKNLAAGIGTGAIAYYAGLRPKASAADVSRGITQTVLWATLYVLLVHFIVAFYEFD